MRIADGERKLMRSKFRAWDNELKVEAYRVDADTPYVILTDKHGNEIYLTDVGAYSVMERISKALDLLPSSK